MTVRVQPADEPDRLAVRFPFSRDLVDRIKSVAGRRWHPEKLCWSVPRSRRTAERLESAFDEHELEIAPELTDLFPVAGTGAAQEAGGELLERMRQELRLRGYGARTRKNYLGHARRFLEWAEIGSTWWEAGGPRSEPTAGAPSSEPGSGASSEEPAAGEARRYLLHLLEEKEVSHAYGSQCVSALKFLLLTYSAGLRVGEVVRLRVEDIDPDRGLIHVRRAKGRKDRYVMLSDVAWTTLRTYTRIHRSTCWLFPGGRPGRHLTARSVQKVVERARERAGIRKSVSPHSLRHAFATHLLEAGTDLRYIQELLGHASSRTTEIYTRVTRRDLARIRSPLDDLEAEKDEDGPRLRRANRGPGEPGATGDPGTER